MGNTEGHIQCIQARVLVERCAVLGEVLLIQRESCDCDQNQLKKQTLKTACLLLVKRWISLSLYYYLLLHCKY